MKRTSLPIAVLTLALIPSACSGDDGDGHVPEGASDVDGDDLAIAEAALLALDDFPPGWEAQPPNDDEDEDGQRRMADCVGVGYDDLYGSGAATATSDTFGSSDDEEISQDVSVAADEDVIVSNFEIFASAEFQGCMVEGVQDQIENDAAIEPGTEVGDITIGEISFDDYGDDTLALRMTIPIASQGLSVDAYGDFVVVRVGRAATTISSFSVLSPFNVDQLSEYTNIAVDRLTESLDGASAGTPSSNTDGDEEPDTTTTTEPAVETAAPDASPHVTSFGDLDAVSLAPGTQGEVSVIAYGSQVAFGGSVPVVVHNMTSDDIGAIEVSGTARDSDGSLLYTGSSQGIQPAIVAPGEIAFGYVYLDSDAELPEQATFEFSVSHDEYGDYFLPVTVTEVVRNDSSFVGTVTNDNDDPVGGPIDVGIICLNAEGVPFEYPNGFMDQDALEPGQTGSFTIDLFDRQAECERGLVAASGFEEL